MTAKKTTNRNCLIPNEGGFRPAGSVVFNELAIELILTTSVNLGAARQGQTLAYYRDYTNDLAARVNHVYVNKSISNSCSLESRGANE